MLNRDRAAAAIRAEFPEAKVLWCESMFIDGIGVELPDGRRNAVAVRGENQWGEAADKLLAWLRRERRVN